MAEQLEINLEMHDPVEAEDQIPSSDLEESFVMMQELSEMPTDSLSPDDIDTDTALAKTGEEEKEGPQQRIKLLEQALEQCQTYIDELKSQLVDQAFLAEQLASTEEFSHIQKQAVITLQEQLANRQQLQDELEALQKSKADQSDRLAERDANIRFKDAELVKLHDQVAEERLALDRLQDQAERLSLQIQSSQKTAVHETQQRIIAQTTAERLRTQLRECEAAMQTLEVQLQQSRESYKQQQEMITALQNATKSDSHKNQAIQSLSASLLKAQNKLVDLETQCSNQSIMQAQFQHSTQEFAEKAQVWQSRSEELEQQVAEMQEQILHQAQQASEYETAVQHWKDRSFTADQTVAQMKQILEHLLSHRQETDPPLPAALNDVITALSQTWATEDLETSAARTNLKLDLPALLNRWRHTKL